LVGPAADKSKRGAPKKRTAPRNARNDQAGSSVTMRKLALAALTLAVTTQANAAEPRWEADCRHGWIAKDFEEIDEDGPIVIIDGTRVRITHDEVRKLAKDLPLILRQIKACDAFTQCLSDRDAGKVKHCYWNDRRWRDMQ
jgi:hypothetical protein